MATNRLLVTGATGFVGSWTLRHWRKAHPEVEVWAASDQSLCLDELADEFSVFDLCDGKAVRDFINKCNPTHVIHLAGLVTKASLTEHLTVNVLGTENLYKALSELDRSIEIPIIQAGTAAIYGQILPEELPINENNPLRPLTAYAISKITQEYLAGMFWRTRGLNIIQARIFNLVGPGQPTCLIPATFIKQLKIMCDGESLQMGNLATRRDFVDVRDVVLAFDKLLAGGQPGKAYNIGSGSSIAIRDILNNLFIISGLQNISIKQELARMRKNDVPDVVADVSAITKAVGWQPQISLLKSLKDMWKEHSTNYTNGNSS
ncbi:NAD-dependent epimerase/dehydratase family protein [Planctomycetota bacterium]